MASAQRVELRGGACACRTFSLTEAPHFAKPVAALGGRSAVVVPNVANVNKSAKSDVESIAFMTLDSKTPKGSYLSLRFSWTPKANP